ncbi:MAG: ATP-binding protein [Candidatus Hadarchaeum sp.]|uniref:ATP-binding protein n=1 Tax=Candidatus Hadarchaeum sp. TaxID=2883567 RepID=UPI003172BEBE
MEEAKIMEILTDWNFWGSFREDLRARTAYLSKLEEIFGKGAATILLGVRRAGKSSLAYLFIRKLINQRTIEPKDTLVVNFEDPRFPSSIGVDDLMQIYEVYLRKLDPSRHIVLLDEVQDVAGWEKFVRYLLESKKAGVILTGSSSKLLGREISTVLTGRHVDAEVFPLSFREFLEFKGVQLGTEVDVVKNRLRILRELEEYLKWGGFPEVTISESEMRKRELLVGYFNDIIMKDVVKRFGVREIEKLESLVELYLSNISTLQSFNRLKDAVKLSLDTVERFSGYLELARMFFSTRKFEFSLKRQLKSVRKVYVIDPGFFHVKGFRVSENYGKLLENVVAIEMLRRTAFSALPLEIYYWRDYQGKEVDFVVREGGDVKQLIQTCYEVEDREVKKREMTALVKASREVHCNNMLVVTWNHEGEEEFNGKRVKFVPLWKWLLEG